MVLAEIVDEGGLPEKGRDHWRRKENQCVNGHPWTKANTGTKKVKRYLKKEGIEIVYTCRRCRACSRVTARVKYHTRRNKQGIKTRRYKRRLTLNR